MTHTVVNKINYYFLNQTPVSIFNNKINIYLLNDYRFTD